jgi:hypothetical protein
MVDKKVKSRISNNEQNNSYQLFDSYDEFMNSVFSQEIFSGFILTRFLGYFNTFHPLLGYNHAEISSNYFYLPKILYMSSHVLIILLFSLIFVNYTSLNDGNLYFIF